VVWEGRSREAPPYPDRPEARNADLLFATIADRERLSIS
jgi:hypothetical protein